MAKTMYLWADDNIIAEYDSTGPLQASYHYDPQPYGNLVSEQLAIGQNRQYHFDAIGSTVTSPVAASKCSHSPLYRLW